MAREKAFYRENLEILNNRYPDHDMLSVEEIMQVTGIKSLTTSGKEGISWHYLHRRS